MSPVDATTLPGPSAGVEGHSLPTGAPGDDVEQDSTGLRTLIGMARAEVLVGLWRIGQAVRHMDDRMSAGTKRRWERGVARELVRRSTYGPALEA